MKSYVCFNRPLFSQKSWPQSWISTSVICQNKPKKTLLLFWKIEFLQIWYWRRVECMCKCVCLPNRESYLGLHMPSTFCSKFPVDVFSSNFVLWFWLNEPKVCTWNILRYTFNFNMGNQSMAMIFYLPACVYECISEKENASYVNLQRSFSHKNQQTHMKWVCTIYLQHQRILKNQI